jgi:hypothetical protein
MTEHWTVDEYRAYLAGKGAGRKRKTGGSELERLFAHYWRTLAPDAPAPEREYRFAAYIVGGPGKGVRKRLEDVGLYDWRFDFAWPEHGKVAVETEGGTFSDGRHTRGAGYAEDCAKYNAATLAGWRVLRYTTDMLENDPAGVIAQVVEAVNA